MGRIREELAWFGDRLAIPIAGILVIAALAVLVAFEPTDDASTLTNVLLLSILLGAIVVGLLTLRGETAPDDDRIAPAPWTEAGGIVERAPERTTDDPALSGEALAVEIDRAGAVARDEGTVADGVAAIRPTLATALYQVLVHGGMDEAAAKRAILEGTWTDDRAVAATLSPEIRRPDWPLRDRIRAWLFPERILRREVRRAVHEIGVTAEDRVPTVPGRTAPRTVPVVRPGLAELRRGADGELQAAVDPLADPTKGAGAAADGDRMGRDAGQVESTDTGEGERA